MNPCRCASHRKSINPNGGLQPAEPFLRPRSASRVQMTAAEQDEFADIRDAVAKLCAQFLGEYWRKLDREMAYPSAFVDALTKAGYLSVLIPEEYGGAGLELSP